jgi:OFA family oxalate/formate antiporter-like MFS transporter
MPINRWRYAAAAIFLQVLLGILYSWSVFRGPLENLHGWTKAQSVLPYRYSLIVFAIGMIIGGFWQDRKGPRVVASLGAVLLSLGCAVAGAFGGQLEGLVIGYGVIAGLGVGFAYVTPISMCVKWFPDRRGMIVGLAVMGFGLGPLVFGPLLEVLIGKDPSAYATTIPNTFYILAVIFLIGAVGAAQFFAVPPAGWKPEGWTPKSGATADLQVAPGDAVRGLSFYLLWLLYFVGTAVGLTVIGEASPLLREAAKRGAWASAGAGLGIMSIFNGLGRLGWGSVSDRYGRGAALYGMAGLSAIACFGILRTADTFTMSLIGLSLAAFCYGGYLALMPALTADFYGAKHMGANYGFVFTAWGLCGFLVPGYFAGKLDGYRQAGQMAQGYSDVFGLLALVAGSAAVLSWATLWARRRA